MKSCLGEVDGISDPGHFPLWLEALAERSIVMQSQLQVWMSQSDKNSELVLFLCLRKAMWRGHDDGQR